MHYVAHILHLAVLDASKSVPYLQKFEDRVEKKFLFYHYSPECRREVKEIADILQEDLLYTISLKQICWSANQWKALTGLKPKAKLLNYCDPENSSFPASHGHSGVKDILTHIPQLFLEDTHTPLTNTEPYLRHYEWCNTLLCWSHAGHQLLQCQLWERFSAMNLIKINLYRELVWVWREAHGLRPPSDRQKRKHEDPESSSRAPQVESTPADALPFPESDLPSSMLSNRSNCVWAIFDDYCHVAFCMVTGYSVSIFPSHMTFSMLWI